MKSKLKIYIFLMLILIALNCGSQRKSSIPIFRIMSKKGNKVEVNQEKSAAIFSIFSDMGIGSADISLRSGNFPNKIVLKLHLKGLEEFKLNYNNLTIIASISSITGKIREKVIKNGTGDWEKISSESPYWMNIKILTPEGIPENQIPIQEGYIEIQLPEDFIKARPTSFSIEWIDFFRG